MRECIYCGKSLEKGELCSCAMSVSKRRAKEEMNSAANSEPKKKSRKEESKKAYAKAEKEREKAQRKAKKQPRYNTRDFSGGARKSAMGGNVFTRLGRNLLSFFKSPTEAIMNPVGMGKVEIFILAAFEGIILGLCTLSILTGTSRGAFMLLGNLFGFNGIAGYNFLYVWLLSALWGALGMIVLLMVYTAIFFAIGKWIFRQFATFWDYAKRLVFAMLPMTLIGVLGTVLGMFSQLTFATLLICGLAGNVAITYEVLRSMWSSRSAARTLYAMMLGMFLYINVLLVIIINIVRLSLT